MDKLDRIFEMQNLLDTDIRVRRQLEFTQEEWMQKQLEQDQISKYLEVMIYHSNKI